MRLPDRAGPSRRADGGAPVRAAAAQVLARVVRGAALEDALADSPSLAERDGALLRSLSYGGCRWHHRLDWQVGRLLDRPLGAREVELAALLRVGLLQLQMMRIPDHAAVSATVDAAKLIGAARARGLVNAVLRRFLRESATLASAAQAEPVPRYSHPAWLIETIRRERPDDGPAVLDANNAQPPMWLRVNVRRTTPERYAERLAGAGIALVPAAPGEERPTAALLLAEPMPAARLPGFDDGDVSVQDAGAQHAPPYLALEPGQRVLDACAAPGGKAAQILECCPDLRELVAVDRDAARLATAGELLRRLGLEATLVHGDAAAPAAWWDGEPFDRVLLDAPCSALGVIRRHPDIKLLREPADLDRAAALQARLLAALWPLLRPGGRLLYVTCTLVSAENDGQIERFVAATPDAVLAAPPLQIRPGEANQDGFYYACLRKQQAFPQRA